MIPGPCQEIDGVMKETRWGGKQKIEKEKYRRRKAERRGSKTMRQQKYGGQAKDRERKI